MRLPRVIVACIVLFISSGVVSQQSMQSLVNSGTGEQKMQRLIAMGVESNAAETVAISSEPQLQWLSLQTESNKQLAVLFIPCSGDLAFAYLMRHVGNEWRAVDHDSFDCHYDDSVSLEVATLANKHAQDVLVHHACVSHGTGFVQQDFQVLTVRDGKFQGRVQGVEIRAGQRPVALVGDKSPYRKQRSDSPVNPLSSPSRHAHLPGESRQACVASSAGSSHRRACRTTL